MPLLHVLRKALQRKFRTTLLDGVLLALRTMMQAAVTAAVGFGEGSIVLMAVLSPGLRKAAYRLRERQPRLKGRSLKRSERPFGMRCSSRRTDTPSNRTCPCSGNAFLRPHALYQEPRYGPCS